MKVILCCNYEFPSPIKELAKNEINDNPNWRYSPTLINVIENLSGINVELTQSSDLVKGYIGKKVFGNTLRTYFLDDNNHSQTIDIVDIDTSKKWVIHNQDGYESAYYLEMIDSDNNLYKMELI